MDQKSFNREAHVRWFAIHVTCYLLLMIIVTSLLARVQNISKHEQTKLNLDLDILAICKTKQAVDCSTHNLSSRHQPSEERLYHDALFLVDVCYGSDERKPLVDVVPRDYSTKQDSLNLETRVQKQDMGFNVLGWETWEAKAR